MTLLPQCFSFLFYLYSLLFSVGYPSLNPTKFHHCRHFDASESDPPPTDPCQTREFWKPSAYSRPKKKFSSSINIRSHLNTSSLRCKLSSNPPVNSLLNQIWSFVSFCFFFAWLETKYWLRQLKMMLSYLSSFMGSKRKSLSVEYPH